MARAHETPVAPPTVEPAEAPKVSTPKVVGETPAAKMPATVGDGPVQNAPVAQPTAAPAPAPRVRPVRIPPKPVAQEPQAADEPALSKTVAPVETRSYESSPQIDEAADPSIAPSWEAATASQIFEPAHVDDPLSVAEPVGESSAEPQPEPIPPMEQIESEPPTARDDRVETKRVAPPSVMVPVEIVAATDVPHSPAPAAPKGAPIPIGDLAGAEPQPTPARRPMLRYYVGGAIGMFFLLLSVLMAGFWVHSFGAIDRALHATTDGQFYWLESSAGAIYFHTERDPTPVDRLTDVWRMEFGDPYSKKDPPPKIPGAALRGVTVAHVPGTGDGGQVQYVVVSYWLPVIVLALPGLWWLRNRRRLQELCRGLRCLRCGYDLRHSPDRCPECGMPSQRSPLVAAEMRRHFANQENLP